ncbi:MAG: VIT1/CCC1 transporter family protein [Verrucomicrobiota bacterium]|nr:VIT1/CCC1 transporter family protein [Verrucomicrobiota bacterium]
MGSHFKGKPPLTHVIEARRKGKLAASEIHGTELPGHYSAAADSAKETAVLLVVLSILLTEWKVPVLELHRFVLILLTAWLVWKVGRSAVLGWMRLERLHRLIEEERWEIEHHRPQEKEELTALYKAKGFSGQMLEEVVEVLMADDNRLLQVMLEEELGLSLETYEHPLKQATGAGVGVLTAIGATAVGFFYLPSWGTLLCAGVVIALAAGAVAHLEKNRLTPAIVWNLAIGALAAGFAYFLGQFQ